LLVLWYAIIVVAPCRNVSGLDIGRLLAATEPPATGAVLTNTTFSENELGLIIDKYCQSKRGSHVLFFFMLLALFSLYSLLTLLHFFLFLLSLFLSQKKGIVR